MRRIEPAYPDLFPVTHVLRPGYMPGNKVSLDPIKLGVVWEDAPVRILPAEGSVPREPVRAMVFARVAAERHQPTVLQTQLDSTACAAEAAGGLVPTDAFVPFLSHQVRASRQRYTRCRRGRNRRLGFDEFASSDFHGLPSSAKDCSMSSPP